MRREALHNEPFSPDYEYFATRPVNRHLRLFTVQQMSAPMETMPCLSVMVALSQLCLKEGIMLSATQSAEQLEASSSRVRTLIKNGTLAVSKNGREWVLREEDVLQQKQRQLIVADVYR